MWINLQRLHSRRRVVQTSILIGICIYIAISFRALNYKVSLGETNGKSTEESLILLEVFTKAVQEILNETPYLWRRLDISNDTSRSRIESQREWIARFSRTNFSHFLKVSCFRLKYSYALPATVSDFVEKNYSRPKQPLVDLLYPRRADELSILLPTIPGSLFN